MRLVQCAALAALLVSCAALCGCAAAVGSLIGHGRDGARTRAVPVTGALALQPGEDVWLRLLDGRHLRGAVRAIVRGRAEPGATDSLVLDAVQIVPGASITAPIPLRRVTVATDQIASLRCRELGHKGTHVTLFTLVGLALDVGLIAGLLTSINQAMSSN